MILGKHLLILAVLLTALSACSSGSDNEDENAGDNNASVDANSGNQSSDDFPDDSAFNDDYNFEPYASAEPVAGYLGDKLTLDATGSTDPEGSALSYRWDLISVPSESSVSLLADSNSERYSFTPDVRGEYVFELTVSDPEGGTSFVQVSAVASIPLNMLSYRPVDVEYSKSLDRMVLLSAAPNMLHILNARTMETTNVALNLVPSAVSVSPDGMSAVVGHDGWVSHIDLAAATLLDVIPVSTNAGDIVLSGNGYAYVFPGSDQFAPIHVLNLETKEQFVDDEYSIIQQGVAKLHPDGKFIYSSDSFLEKIAIADGAVSSIYNPQNSADGCGDLWFAEDAIKMFTGCGTALRTSEDASLDLTYLGSFSETSSVAYVAHSTEANELAVLPGSAYWSESIDDSKTVQLYDYDFFAFTQSIEIPAVIKDGKSLDTVGEFIFYSADGGEKFLVLRTRSEDVWETPRTDDFGIWMVSQ